MYPLLRCYPHERSAVLLGSRAVFSLKPTPVIGMTRCSSIFLVHALYISQLELTEVLCHSKFMMNYIACAMSEVCLPVNSLWNLIFCSQII